MADGDRQTVAGWVVHEDHRLPWSKGVSEPELRLCVTGEIGHVRWLLFLAAQREIARRELDTLLTEFAQRVGIEYSPSQRRREAPDNDHNDHNGGQP